MTVHKTLFRFTVLFLFISVIIEVLEIIESLIEKKVLTHGFDHFFEEEVVFQLQPNL